MKDYVEQAMRTQCPQAKAFERIADQPGQFIPLLHCVIGMMGELGELASNLEKAIWYGQPFDAINFVEELGDVNWYEAEALQLFRLKLEEVLEKNIAKLKKRFPEKYTDAAAKEENRDRAAERKILEQQLDKCGITPLNPEPIESYQRSTQVPNDPYIQTGAGWAEPAEEGSLAEYIIDKVAQAVKNEPIQSDVSIATLREWAALVDNNIPDCKLSNQIKQAALNQGIALHLIQACSSWSEVVDLMEKEKKPQHLIYCNYQNGPLGAPGCICLKPLPKPFIESSGFVLARRIADTYVEGQNKARALAEIARAEKEFNNASS